MEKIALTYFIFRDITIKNVSLDSKETSWTPCEPTFLGSYLSCVAVT